MIFPYTAAAGWELSPVPERTGPQIHAELSGLGLRDLPDADVFAAGALWPNGPYLEVPGRFTSERPAPSAHFAVRDTAESRTAGHVALHELSPQGGHVKCSVAVDGAVGGDTALEAAAVLAVNYAFATWRLRKVYLWSLDRTPPGLDRAGVPYTEEAALPEHVKAGGLLHTAHVFAVYRDDWDRVGTARAERLAGAG